MKITAIIVVLNDAEFITPCIRAIYDFVDQISIQTNYDRGWNGSLISPDDTVKKILEIPDEKGKISLHVMRMPDDAFARNQLMRSATYKLNHKYLPVFPDDQRIKMLCEPPDYFWIIDADEIYDPLTISGILKYLTAEKPNILRIHGVTYFKSWNYKISPSYWFCHAGFIKPGNMIYDIREFYQPQWFRLIRNKYWNMGRRGDYLIDFTRRLRGEKILPHDIAVFHHGSFIGDNKRMRKKLLLSPHTHSKDSVKNWYRNVWEKWTPDTRNFHPLKPWLFKSVEYVYTEELPDSIKNIDWPTGYIKK